jgi:hypothetical protein
MEWPQGLYTVESGARAPVQCSGRILTRINESGHVTEEHAGSSTHTSRVIRPEQIYAGFLDPDRSDRLASSNRDDGRDPRIRRPGRRRISDVAVLPAECARFPRHDVRQRRYSEPAVGGTGVSMEYRRRPRRLGRRERSRSNGKSARPADRLP